MKGRSSTAGHAIRRALVVAALLSVQGCAGLVLGGAAEPAPDPAGRGAVQLQRDAQITNRIQNAFLHDEQIAALRIQVRTVYQTVELRGSVPDELALRRALQLAGRTEGVRRVVNYLRVEP